MGNRKHEAEFAWERRIDESPEAYEAFSKYRDLDASERSLQRVARELSKSLTLMKRWSAEHEWVERVNKYEAYLDAIALKKAQTQIIEMRARQIKIGQQLQTKGLKRLLSIDDSLIEASDALRMVTDGMKVEADRAKEELAARTPRETGEDESDALAKLDELLGKIDSGF